MHLIEIRKGVGRKEIIFINVGRGMGGRYYDNGCLAPLSMFQLYHGSLFGWRKS